MTAEDAPLTPRPAPAAVIVQAVVRPRNLNLANIVTLLRIAIVPPTVWLLSADFGPPGPAGDWGKHVALVLILLGSVSDYVDGVLARRHATETNLGRFLDPIADKLLVCSVFAVLVGMGRIPAWVLILMLWREFCVLGLRMHLAADGHVLAASRSAKYKTTYQMAATVIVAMVLSMEVLAADGVAIPRVTYCFFAQVADAAIMVSLVFSLVSGLEYFVKHLPDLRRQD